MAQAPTKSSSPVTNEATPAGRKRSEPRPELSSEDVQERVWSTPGGDERALREAKTGVDADVDNQTDAVERETPADALRRLSDPGLDHGVLGPDEKVGSENAGKNKGLGNEGRFSEHGDTTEKQDRK